MDECQERGRAEGQLRAFESERRDTLSVLDVCKVARPAVADEHEQRVPAVAGQALVAAVLADPGGGRWLGHHGVRPVPTAWAPACAAQTGQAAVQPRQEHARVPLL